MRTSLVLLILSWAVGAAAAPKSEAEKARAKAEKKLESFTKEYDPSKNLARKGAELDKDVAELDKELETLTGLDPAAGAELKSKREAAVAAARDAVGGAVAGKAAEDVQKKFDRVSKDYDPDKKNLTNVDAKSLERSKKELDELIGKLSGDEKAKWSAKRDELFTTIEKAKGAQAEAKLREFIKPFEPMAAAPGIEAITPVTPSWCEGVLESLGKSLQSQRPGLPERFQGRLEESILYSCMDPEFEVRKANVASYRQAMSNALGLTAAQNLQLMMLGRSLFLMDDAKLKATGKQLCDEQLAPLPDAPAAERGNRSLARIAMGCGNRLSDENAMRRIDVDTPGGLTSQLAIVGLMGLVLPTETAEKDQLKLQQASNIAVLSTVPLELAAFETELSVLKLNVVGEARARLAFFQARARFAQYTNAYKALAPKLPGLTKLVFEAPAAAAKAYVAKQAALDKPLLDTVLSLEAQQGPVKGCAAKLWPFFEGELKPQLKSSLEAVRLSGLLAWAMAECASRDPSAPAMEPVFTYFAERSTPVRGPLTAAYLGYVEAYNAAAGNEAAGESDRSGRGRGGPPLGGGAGLPPPDRNPIGEAALTPSLFGHANSLNPDSPRGGAVIKTIEKKGDSVRLTFRTEKYLVPDLSCVETGKIDRINLDGTISYRKLCKKVGEHEETATTEPVELPAFAAAGIAPGNLVELYWMSVNSGAPGRAFIIEAFDSKARGKRVSFFGVAQ